MKNKVRVRSSRRGPAWEVELPAGVDARLNAPFTPIFAHRQTVRRMGEQDCYEVALLAMSLNLDGPALPGPVTVRIS